MMTSLPLFQTVTLAPGSSGYGDIKPGDFFLIQGNNFYDKIIRFGQSLRYGKSKNCSFTHAGMFINSNGGIVEANMSGVHQSTIDKYTKYTRKIVYLNITDEDRSQMLLFAKACLNEGYGFLTIASLAWSLLTGSKFSIGLDGEEICSGLVARSLERTSYIPLRDASHITPADLSEQFTENLTNS